MMSLKEQNIKVEKIMKWIPEVIKETFTDYEHFGHLFERHVNKEDEYLRRRCITERVDASTFIGYEAEILKMVVESLNDNENINQIAEYLANEEWTDACGIFCKLTDNVKGVIYLQDPNRHNWDNHIYCREFVIYIRKTDARTNNDFFIESVYPISD